MARFKNRRRDIDDSSAALPNPINGNTGKNRRRDIDDSSAVTGSSSRDLLNSDLFWKQTAGQIGTQADNNFIQQLLNMMSQSNDVPGTHDDDYRQKLVDMLLDNLTKQEQRDYDKSVLQEQRAYDTPMAQLARLMGAGISRDAAIQMLQGGQDAALVGSGADVSSGEAMPNSPERIANVVNTATGILNAVGSLVSLGFTIPQALQQTHFLRNQNYLSDKQIQSFQSAGKAFSILNAAGSASKAFSSTASAIGAIQKLADSGNSDAATFINSGEVDAMRANAPFVSQALTNMYQSEHKSDLFRKELRAADLRNSLTSVQIDSLAQGIHESVARIRKLDKECDKIYQDLQYGAIQIEIAGEMVTVAESAGKRADLDIQSLGAALSMRDNEGHTLPQIMGMNEFYELWEHMQSLSVHQEDPEAFLGYLRSNRDAAFSVAYIDYLVNQKMSDIVENAVTNGDDASLYEQLFTFHKMLHSAGIGSEVVQSSGNAFKAGVEILKLFLK